MSQPSGLRVGPLQKGSACRGTAHLTTPASLQKLLRSLPRMLQRNRGWSRDRPPLPVQPLVGYAAAGGGAYLARGWRLCGGWLEREIEARKGPGWRVFQILQVQVPRSPELQAVVVAVHWQAPHKTADRQMTGEL